jgi:hypothetical protein
MIERRTKDTPDLAIVICISSSEAVEAASMHSVSVVLCRKDTNSACTTHISGYISNRLGLDE